MQAKRAVDRQDVQKTSDKRCVFLSALAALLLPLMVAASVDQEQSYDIQASLLSEALLSFGQQAGVTIIFGADSDFDTALERTFQGKYALRDLLEQLLSGTMLEAEFIHDDVIAVRPKACVATQSCEAIQGRIADYDALASNPSLEKMLIIGKMMTGSRIRRTEFTGSAPVDIISAFDIELAGAQTVGELLRDLPSVVGNSTSTSISNGGDGTASVTLRGLPSSNTLVLLNGRRVSGNGLSGEFFDLNSLAPSSIERIEVLKSGSSAVYGSDAIAGVINIILKKEFEGLQVDSYIGRSSEDDLETRTTSFSAGKIFSRGSIFLSGTVFDQEGIFSRDRRVSANADTRLIGGVDKRSSATTNARIAVPAVGDLIFNGATGDSSDPAAYRQINRDDLFNFSEFTSAIVPSRRESLYGSAIADINDSLAASVELGYTSSKAVSTLAPTPIFTAFEAEPITIAADNVFNPFGVEIIDARKRLLEFDPRQQINRSEAIRAAAGLQGKTRELQWDIGWHWSKTDASEVASNLVDAAKLARGLSGPANCAGEFIDGCTPVNIFGPVGSLTTEQRDFLRTDARVEGFSRLYGLTVNSNFSLARLPAGMLDVAVGYEYRRESIGVFPIAPVTTIGGTNITATVGNRRVQEFYFESLLPLQRDSAGKDSLSIEIAGRYSRYSDFGSTFNPRVGLKYRPLPDLILRASYAEGFRAPSLLELFSSASESQAFLVDPCSNPDNLSLPGCSQTTDMQRLQFLTLNGGNTELKAEESKFRSFGLHWSPEYLPKFSASLDYFNIDQRNVVDANAQFILDQNANSSIFSNRVVRDANGEINRIIATKLNIGRRKVQGLDLAMHYAVPNVRHGRMHFSLNASRLLAYDEQLIPSLPAEDLLGTFADEASEGRGALPKWKANAGMYWKYKQWQINYTYHYISSLNEALLDGRMRRIDSWSSHDMQTSFLFLVADGLRFTVGVKNLTDESAPLAASAFNDNIDARTHDLIGRYWYVKLAQKF